MKARSASRLARFAVVLVLVAAFSLVIATSAFALTWYDEDNANFVYSGSWLIWTDPGLGFYGSTMKYTNTAGSEVNFSFSGTSIQYRAWTGPIYGQHEIIVDGGAPETVDLNRAAYSSLVVWTKSGLANTAHTVKIRRTTNTYLSIDAIGVEGSIPPAAVSTSASSSWSIGLALAAGLALAGGATVALRRARS